MNLTDIIIAIIYGLVEGITEWLPISSTGHLIILNDFLSFKEVNPSFFELFLVVIQLGAIFAVVVSYFKKLNPFSKKLEKEEKKSIYKTWILILISCIPAAIVGLLFDDLLDKYLYNKLTVSITLIVYGIVFIILEYFNSKRQIKYEEVKDFTYKTALIIGLAQVLALIPGTSRSGITIISALLIGCSRKSSCEFSFFLSLPIMIGASLLKLVKYFIKGNLLTLNEGLVLFTGIIMSFAVSILIINFLMNYIKKKDFKIFGYYRIILGIVLIFYMISMN
ncbi:MAG: undecaprenyl-diphosphate phosphatase [Bacilli bacterium]|nr:undecaprenyl-diphosphate phosphatase [Bacilli bacterium]